MPSSPTTKQKGRGGKLEKALRQQFPDMDQPRIEAQVTERTGRFISEDAPAFLVVAYSPAANYEVYECKDEAAMKRMVRNLTRETTPGSNPIRIYELTGKRRTARVETRLIFE